MGKNVIIIMFGLILGFFTGFYLYFYTPVFTSTGKNTYTYHPQLLNDLLPFHKNVIGFLPYWLINKANSDYSPYISTLTYFGLTIDTNGKILKLANAQEEEPGWYSLRTDKLHTYLDSTKNKGISLSLLVFSGGQDAIDTLIDDPVTHADNLTTDVIPLMKQYGFNDLNIDIEKTSTASNEARMHFTQFIQKIKQNLDDQHAGTLTIDMSPTDLIKKDLIDPVSISQSANHIVLMTYDYHYLGSYVTGPVAPLSGAGVIAEFDVDTAIQKALEIMPAEKIILGVPLYGYAWETINNSKRSAVIPGTGDIASNIRTESFLSSCTTCSAQFDSQAQEAYVIYKDQSTGTYHQIFYPIQQSIAAKVTTAKTNNLGGIALWALGYEDISILNPLRSYK